MAGRALSLWLALACASVAVTVTVAAPAPALAKKKAKAKPKKPKPKPPPPKPADAGAKVRERLQKGKALYESQDYRAAIRELSPVPRDPAATRSQRLQALELLGLCWFILGDEGKAREAFEDLLAIDPGYELEEASGSPKIEAFFREVKQAFVPDSGGGKASLEHAAPTGAVAGRRLELSAEITSGTDIVKEVVVLWRRRGVLEYERVPMNLQKGARWRARFTPPGDTGNYTIEYYIEARDIGGRAVARAGSPELPLAIPVKGAPAVAKRTWYDRWYVWAGAGVVAIGATAITLSLTAEDAPAGTLGTVTLP